MGYCLGIDIGGTKTAIGISSGSTGRVKCVTFPTVSERGAADLVARIAEHCKSLMAECQIERVDFAGVACPGPLDVKSGRIVYIATMGFIDVPIRKMLEEALNIPIYLENDANCAALAEYSLGVARGMDPLVYVTVSTGIGCGIIVNGQILSGAHSSGGELGHFTVEPNGRPCPCGKFGCLEQYASGTAIARDGGASTKAVFDLAREGNQEMMAIVDAAADRLGFALSGVYHLIDPQAIVLGGSVTRSYDVFSKRLMQAVEQYTQPIAGRRYEIAISEFDGNQGVIGAILYGCQQHEIYFRKGK